MSINNYRHAKNLGGGEAENSTQHHHLHQPQQDGAATRAGGGEGRPLLVVDDTLKSGGGRPWWAFWQRRSRAASPATELDGDKQIGTFGSVCLLINSITGPAIVSIPVVVQEAGWVTPLVAVGFMWAVCLLSSLLLVHSMALVPGNSRFQGKVELTTLVKFFFPRWFYLIVLLILIVSLLSLIIASLIVSAQTLDFAFVAVKATCAVEFYPDFGWTCVETAGKDITPFGDSYVLSLGMIVILLIVAPLGYLNLNKNIIVQEAAVVSLIAIVILWTVDFFRKGVEGSIPVVTSSQTNVLGTIMFNFVMAITVPSWCSEKASNVSVKPSLIASTTIASVVFFFVGIIGALAFVYTGDNNLLTMLQSHCDGCFILSRISGYFIPAAIFVTSIPVYAIIVRYNLIDNNLCNKYWAFFFSVIFPWLIAIPFYTGSGLTTVINFASLFLQSTINFILPLLIYIRALHWSRTHNPADHIEHNTTAAAAATAGPDLLAGGGYLTIDHHHHHQPTPNPAYGVKSVDSEAAAGVDDDCDDVDEMPAFRALPGWLMPHATGMAYGLIVVIVLLVGLVVGLNVYQIVHDNV